MEFVHLHCHSPYSFLDGGSSVGELVRRAVAGEMRALALTDHDNVGGAVDFRRTAEKYGVKPIQGVEFTLPGGYHLVALARNAEGYAGICKLLTRAHRRGERGRPRLDPSELAGMGQDLFVLSGCRAGEIPSLLLSGHYREARERALFYREMVGDSLYLELQPAVLPGDLGLHRSLVELSEELDIPLVASADVHYARKADFPVHDLLTCVRTGTTLSATNPERHLNAENYLKSAEAMTRHFRHLPDALRNTLAIAEACEPVPDLGRRRYPAFPLPRDVGAADHLRDLVRRGALERYGHSDGEVAKRLDRELDVIISQGYADYFLLVEDVVRFARGRGIRCAGRGSAADSAVAYCLGITEVDALGRNLLFERFMSPERGEKPDIDVDFDARHRDRVADYVRAKYGENRVAGVATFNTFRARSAVRELGKAMGFRPEVLGDLAKRIPRGSGSGNIAEVMEILPEFRNHPEGWEGYERLLSAAAAVDGFPRHISTHCGGLVISDRPLEEVTPLQRSAKGELICQFDKEGVEELGLIKLDLLSLRMLSAVEDAVMDIRTRDRAFDYQAIPEDDEETYAMLHRGETLGVFQLESPAQRALQSRLGASNLEDIIASVALIRPGPIKGDMVEPYIARRHGAEPVTYIHPDLEPILRKTYGVVLFQEQVIEIAVAIAGFSPGEADRLRRVMSRSRPGVEMEELGRLFVERAAQRGIGAEIAEQIYSYLRGYASYGFCEAHAAAFGNTAYRTAYLAQHYPAAFFAAVLSNWPMGYYPPNTLCTEVRRRGIGILPVDVNASGSRFTIEEGNIRISLAQVKGMGGAALDRLLRARDDGFFTSPGDFLRRVDIGADLAENLILCGALASLEPNRRSLLWMLTAGGRRKRVGSFARDIPDFSPEEKIVWERRILGIEAGGSWMGLKREELTDRGFVTTREARSAPEGEEVAVAGTVICPHRPPTRSGKTVVFFSLEDETGLVDVVLFSGPYRRYGHLVFPRAKGPLSVRGEIRRRGGAASVVVQTLEPLSVQ